MLALIGASAHGLVANGIPAMRPATPAIRMDDTAAKAAWLARQEQDWPRTSGSMVVRSKGMPLASRGSVVPTAGGFEDHTDPCKGLQPGEFGYVPMATTKVAAASSEWYYPEPLKTSDQFDPAFGDNTYARRTQLSSAAGVAVPTGQATGEWYYPPPLKTSDQFDPAFGDNTYARRRSLNQPGA